MSAEISKVQAIPDTESRNTCRQLYDVRIDRYIPRRVVLHSSKVNVGTLGRFLSYDST
jgi:hypothetical protein